MHERFEDAPYPIITLCGSTKFEDNFIEWNKRLTLAGFCVLSVGVFRHKIPNFSMSEKRERILDKIHLQKIKMSDAIFVLNVNNYIGESTKNEIYFALENGKAVFFLNRLDENQTQLIANMLKQKFPDFKFPCIPAEAELIAMSKFRDFSVEKSEDYLLQIKKCIDSLKLEL